MDGRIRDQDAAERLGQNVLAARRRAGFSQEELGALAGLHRTEIGFVEGGRRLPRADTLIKLASALGVDAEELLAGVEWIIPHPVTVGQLRRDGRKEEGQASSEGDGNDGPSARVLLRLPRAGKNRGWSQILSF